MTSAVARWRTPTLTVSRLFVDLLLMLLELLTLKRDFAIQNKVMSQRRGFDPPLGKFSGRGDFSLGVNMCSNSIPPKTLSDESINRGLVCAHMHFIARTQKILTFMS